MISLYRYKGVCWSGKPTHTDSASQLELIDYMYEKLVNTAIQVRNKSKLPLAFFILEKPPLYYFLVSFEQKRLSPQETICSVERLQMLLVTGLEGI